ncbi:hypothetical protein JCM12825_03580 [Desulfurobacterium crinifex]
MYVENLPEARIEREKGGRVNKNESLHAVLRDRVLKRRTRNYSKSEKALSCHIAIALT